MKKIILITIAAFFTMNVWGQTNTFPPTGNVGIGTTAPSQPLHLLASTPILNIQTNSAGFVASPISRKIIFSSYLNTEAGSINLFDYHQETTRTEMAFTIKNNDGNLQEALRINYNGNVGIGTTNPTYKLSVNGTIGCGEVKVEDVTTWADFVFETEYNLMSLKDLETYIKANKHLPEIPTTAQVEENGIAIGEMNAKLLQKIEELTLYVIELQKKNEEQDKKIEELEIK